MKYYRTTGLLDLDRVSQKTVLLLGLGSLGSLCAENLAYPFKKLVLVDPENLEEHNVERHLLGRSWVGKPKVEGVKNWLLDRGIPETCIETHACFAQEILDNYTDADVVVVSIDHMPSCEDINRWCFENCIPALYGGIYAKGTGGRIFVVPTPQEVCFSCVSYLIGKNESIQNKNNYGLDLAVVSATEAPQAVPALRWPIGSVACDMADFALDMLSGVRVEPQLFVHSHTGETPALDIFSGSTLRATAALIADQLQNCILPSYSVRKGEQGFDLRIKRGTLSILLTSSAHCSVHSKRVELAEI